MNKVRKIEGDDAYFILAGLYVFPPVCWTAYTSTSQLEFRHDMVVMECINVFI